MTKSQIEKTVAIEVPIKMAKHVRGMLECSEGYEPLIQVLMDALAQSALGKGKERHAAAGLAFRDQPIMTEMEAFQSPVGGLQQARKKELESVRLWVLDGPARANTEMLGAVVYAAAVALWYYDQIEDEEV